MSLHKRMRGEVNWPLHCLSLKRCNESCAHTLRTYYTHDRLRDKGGAKIERVTKDSQERESQESYHQLEKEVGVRRRRRRSIILLYGKAATSTTTTTTTLSGGKARKIGNHQRKHEAGVHAFFFQGVFRCRFSCHLSEPSFFFALDHPIGFLVSIPLNGVAGSTLFLSPHGRVRLYV